MCWRGTLSLLVFTVAALAAGCRGEQELRQYCAGADAGCPPCRATTECVIVSNPCHATAYCAPRAVRLAVTQEGCNHGYDPPAATCECLTGTCAVVPRR